MSWVSNNLSLENKIKLGLLWYRKMKFDDIEGHYGNNHIRFLVYSCDFGFQLFFLDFQMLFRSYLKTQYHRQNPSYHVIEWNQKWQQFNNKPGLLNYLNKSLILWLLDKNNVPLWIRVHIQVMKCSVNLWDRWGYYQRHQIFSKLHNAYTCFSNNLFMEKKIN